jgi:hypothetical protein
VRNAESSVSRRRAGHSFLARNSQASHPESKRSSYSSIASARRTGIPQRRCPACAPTSCPARWTRLCVWRNMPFRTDSAAPTSFCWWAAWYLYRPVLQSCNASKVSGWRARRAPATRGHRRNPRRAAKHRKVNRPWTVELSEARRVPTALPTSTAQCRPARVLVLRGVRVPPSVHLEHISVLAMLARSARHVTLARSLRARTPRLVRHTASARLAATRLLRGARCGT